MVNVAQAYQKAMNSTAVAYRKITYIDLQKNTYQRIYPEGGAMAEGRFSETVASRCAQGEVFEGEVDLVEDFLELGHLRSSLSGQDYIECRYRRRMEQGNYEWCAMAVTVVERREGMPVTATLMIRSIDKILQEECGRLERLAVEAKRAELANRTKNEYLSRISHDIRTPMHAILGMVTLAAVHIDNREQVMEALDKIAVSGGYLLDMVDDILDLSKIESGNFKLYEREFCLADIMDGLLTLFGSQMDAKGLEFKLDFGEMEHGRVFADEKRLRQVFENILGNAVKFTPEGGKIAVSVSEKPSESPGCGWYEFVFEDNGIGMEPAYLSQIFEPFSRARDARQKKIEGTGLGMSIANDIVQMMGGDIRVESEPGKGSRFCVVVPLKYRI